MICLLIAAFLCVVQTVYTVALLREHAVTAETIQSRIDLFAPGTPSHQNAVQQMAAHRRAVRVVESRRNVLIVASVMLGVVLVALLLQKERPD